jgi:hypothetical protein
LIIHKAIASQFVDIVFDNSYNPIDTRLLPDRQVALVESMGSAIDRLYHVEVLFVQVFVTFHTQLDHQLQEAQPKCPNHHEVHCGVHVDQHMQ